MIRHAVESARRAIGLNRVGIFLVDEASSLMTGTWGTDMNGRTVDEHHVMCALSDEGRRAFRRAAVEAIPWTLVEDCPIVVQLERETRVLGRGWVACTPIASACRPIAMMFNDSGLSGKPLDPARQTLAAILCAFLGTVLDRDRPERAPHLQAPRVEGSALSALTGTLADDPSLSAASLAQRHGMSATRLCRMFKSELGMSLVEYRNRLRMDRFLSLVQSGRGDLLMTALDAGFGSYAQFHRVFRALHGDSPRAFLSRTRRSGPSRGEK